VARYQNVGIRVGKMKALKKVDFQILELLTAEVTDYKNNHLMWRCFSHG
jgi:hypothetical protein